MENLGFGKSQRPIAGVPVSTALASATIHNVTPVAPWATHEVDPVLLSRTREGRILSLARFLRANEFMVPLARCTTNDWPHFLYGAGIVAQLALSSHLIDVGFPDAWCARHIGLYVNRSLDYANATGLNLRCSETARLTEVLSPYSKWNCLSRDLECRPDGEGFSPDSIRDLLYKMIDHVGNVTGH